MPCRSTRQAELRAQSSPRATGLFQAFGTCQVMPSEAVSELSFVGNPAVFHCITGNTQLGQSELELLIVEYFIKEEIYTPLPGGVEQLAQGKSLTARLRNVCANKRSHVSVRSVFLIWGA